MPEIIEYEPVRRSRVPSDVVFWIIAGLFVLGYLGHLYVLHGARQETAAEAKAERIDRARDRAILLELQDLNDAASRASRDAEIRRRRAYYGMKGEPLPGEPMPPAIP